MAFEKPIDPPLPMPATPCIHLRNKAMFVSGDRGPGVSGNSGSHACWCNRTQHVIGPDKLFVSHEHCDTSRHCYEL
jgi:hypothetical protein